MNPTETMSELPPDVQERINALFDQIAPLAARIHDLSGEFGYNYTLRKSESCQIMITAPEVVLFSDSTKA